MTNLRDQRIAFRLNRNESELIKWAAFNSNETLSEFIRTATLERAGQVLVAVKTEKESA